MAGGFVLLSFSVMNFSFICVQKNKKNISAQGNKIFSHNAITGFATSSKYSHTKRVYSKKKREKAQKHSKTKHEQELSFCAMNLSLFVSKKKKKHEQENVSFTTP
jgi:hypothetical protein